MPSKTTSSSEHTKQAKITLSAKQPKIDIIIPFNTSSPQAIEKLWDKAIGVEDNEKALFARYDLPYPTESIPNTAKELIRNLAKELGIWQSPDIETVKNKTPGRPGIWISEFGLIFFQRVTNMQKRNPKLSRNACIKAVRNQYKEYQIVDEPSLIARYKEIKKRIPELQSLQDVINSLKEHEDELIALGNQIN